MYINNFTVGKSGKIEKSVPQPTYVSVMTDMNQVSTVMYKLILLVYNVKINFYN